MNISEKIQHNTPNEIKIYLEGVFWIAYEQSAYYFWKLKGYKPTKKFVKIVRAEVVSVGFPGSVLEEMGILEKGEKEKKTYIAFEISEAISENEFLEWKKGLTMSMLPLVKTGGNMGNVSPSQSSVIEQIKKFDIAIKTPMECAIFLAEIKKKIINN